MCRPPARAGARHSAPGFRGPSGATPTCVHATVWHVCVRACVRQAEDNDDIEGNELGVGVSGLLYADLQLHTTGRKAAQVVLIQVRGGGGGMRGWGNTGVGGAAGGKGPVGRKYKGG